MKKFNSVRNTYGWTPEVLQRWYRQLSETPGGYLRGFLQPMRVMAQDEGRDLPEWPVNELWLHPSIRPESARWHRRRGICDTPTLFQHFGVSIIPSTTHTSYCVQSEWARARIEEAVVQKQTLPPLIRAAVLDEMYTY